jgi:hypothetical protein
MVSGGLFSKMMLEFRGNLEVHNGVLATGIFTSEVALSKFGKAVKGKVRVTSDTPSTTPTAIGCEGGAHRHRKISRIPQNECVNRMIRSSREFEGVQESFTIDLDGKVQRPVYINRINNERLRFLLKVN